MVSKDEQFKELFNLKLEELSEQLGITIEETIQQALLIIQNKLEYEEK